jgi:hypothetical protein
MLLHPNVCSTQELKHQVARSRRAVDPAWQGPGGHIPDPRALRRREPVVPSYYLHIFLEQSDQSAWTGPATAPDNIGLRCCRLRRRHAPLEVVRSVHSEHRSLPPHPQQAAWSLQCVQVGVVEAVSGGAAPQWDEIGHLCGVLAQRWRRNTWPGTFCSLDRRRGRLLVSYSQRPAKVGRRAAVKLQCRTAGIAGGMTHIRIASQHGRRPDGPDCKELDQEQRTIFMYDQQQRSPDDPCPRACNLTRTTHSRSHSRTFCPVGNDNASTHYPDGRCGCSCAMTLTPSWTDSPGTGRADHGGPLVA